MIEIVETQFIYENIFLLYTVTCFMFVLYRILSDHYYMMKTYLLWNGLIEY